MLNGSGRIEPDGLGRPISDAGRVAEHGLGGEEARRLVEVARSDRSMAVAVERHAPVIAGPAEQEIAGPQRHAGDGKCGETQVAVVVIHADVELRLPGSSMVEGDQLD